MDDNHDVRTPLTIFAFGTGACLALGLMMQHLLRVSQERNQPPIVAEVNRIYGARLDGEAKLRLLRRQEGTLAELSISPLIVGMTGELAREIGHFVWRGNQDHTLIGITVVCEDPLGAGPQRFVIERPFMAGSTPAVASPRPPLHHRPPAGAAGKASAINSVVTPPPVPARPATPAPAGSGPLPPPTPQR